MIDTEPDFCDMCVEDPDAKQTSPRLWRGSRGFFDVTGTDNVEIPIRHDGRVVWVHAGAAAFGSAAR
jgi:hypothetical protein